MGKVRERTVIQALKDTQNQGAECCIGEDPHMWIQHGSVELQLLP